MIFIDWHISFYPDLSVSFYQFLLSIYLDGVVVNICPSHLKLSQPVPACILQVEVGASLSTVQ